jgi:hypothetical protein
MSVINDVDTILTHRIKKDAIELKAATIKTLSSDYLFSSNGILFFCGKMGSGKSYLIMKHILVTERLFSKPYYDLIIYTSTSNSMDKTVESLGKDVKTQILFVPDTEVLLYLEKHIKRKAKFYSITKFILHNKRNDQVISIIKKHNFIKPSSTEINIESLDLNKFYRYVYHKFHQYGFKTYPSNTLLILDDFVGHPLIKKEESPLARIFTKHRHYNLSVILVCQSWRFINRNLKRLCTDICIWKGFSEEDVKKYDSANSDLSELETAVPEI